MVSTDTVLREASGAAFPPAERPSAVRAASIKEDKKFEVTEFGLKISEDIKKALQKFAEKMGKDVQVIAATPGNMVNIDLSTLKNKITIINPISIETSPKRYEVDLMKCGIVNFIQDDICFQFLKDTPATSIYLTDEIEVHYSELYTGYMITDEIFLLFDIMSENSMLKDNFIRKAIMCHILKTYETNAKNLCKRLLFDRKILSDYMHWIGLLKDNSRRALKEKIAGVQQDLNNHWVAINKRERELEESQILYSSIARRLAKNKQDTDEITVTKMFEPLLIKGKYKKFEFTPSLIKAYTGPISITNYKKTYFIGDFIIEIQIDGTIKFTNLTNRKDDYDHPHVMLGVPCLGNIKEMVSKMILNFNFLPLFDLLYEYLSSYNEAGPYIKVEQGWGKPEDWCTPCDNPTASCHCAANVCTSCNLRLDECRCSRCPKLDLLMSEVVCGSCSDYSAEEERCAY